MKPGSPKTVYAFLFKWPNPTHPLTLGCPKVMSTTVISLLGYSQTNFDYKSLGSQGVNITVPPLALDMLPNKWLWTLKITDIAN